MAYCVILETPMTSNVFFSNGVSFKMQERDDVLILFF